MFTSKEYDAETGLYYFGARYLDPQVNRWMSPDPMGPSLANPNSDSFSLMEGINWYGYCSNNPINYVDPIGLDGVNDLIVATDKLMKQGAEVSWEGQRNSRDPFSFALYSLEGLFYSALALACPDDIDQAAQMIGGAYVLNAELTAAAESIKAGATYIVNWAKSLANNADDAANVIANSVDDIIVNNSDEALNTVTNTTNDLKEVFKPDDLFQTFTVDDNGKRIITGVIEYKNIPYGAHLSQPIQNGFKGSVFEDIMEVKGGAHYDLWNLETK